MYNAIRLSSAQQIDVIKNNETFAFYENANNEISLYEVEIIQNNNLNTVLLFYKEKLKRSGYIKEMKELL